MWNMLEFEVWLCLDRVGLGWTLKGGQSDLLSMFGNICSGTHVRSMFGHVRSMFGGMSMFGCNSIALEHVRSMFGNMFGHVRMNACSDGQNQAYVRRSSKAPTKRKRRRNEADLAVAGGSDKPDWLPLTSDHTGWTSNISRTELWSRTDGVEQVESG